MKRKHIKLLLLFLFTHLSLTFAQFKNILISSSNSPEEVSIRINPKNPKQIVAGANINNVYYSHDSGKTWQSNILMDAINGVWGDPIITVDTSGHFYYSHLSYPPVNGTWVDRMVFTKSIDGGKTWWETGTTVGKNGEKVQDKEGVVVNPFNNEIYVTWTQFDKYESKDKKDSSVILFSKSSDGAKTWSKPLRISAQAGDCLDDDGTVEGAVPAVGPNGEIYVVWTGPKGLVFNKSVDGGKTWMPKETFVTEAYRGWAYTIPGLQRCNGLPQTICDLSNTANRGTIYVNFTDQKNGEDNTDVWLIKSTDGGKTWSDRVKVNDDTLARHQFLSWMDVDIKTGYIYCVFYDRRNFSKESHQTDVYLAKSTDGGNTFVNVKINESFFNPRSNIFFGDYIGISVYDDMVRPIWMQYAPYSLSVWTALINGNDIQNKK